MFFKNIALTSGVAAAFMIAGASAASAFTACQVTDVGGIDDSGFNQTAWKGVQDSMAAYGIDGRYLESQSETDYEPNLNALLDAKCDIIRKWYCWWHTITFHLRTLTRTLPVSTA